MGIKIRPIKEDYNNSTDQMNASMKQQQREQKKADKMADSNKEFAIAVLGKVTYNKYVKKGAFAPMPLSALKLEFETFYKLNPDNKNIRMLDDDDIQMVEKLIDRINKIYNTKLLKVRDNGFKKVISADGTLKRFDDVIDFLKNVLQAFKFVYKREDINWQPLSLKFRKYLN